MSIKIRVWVATDRVGSECSDEFEIEDSEGLSDSEIEEYARDVMWNMAEWGWEKVT